MGVETVSLIIAAFVSGSLGIASLMRNFRSRLCIWFSAMTGMLFAHDALSVLESFHSAFRFASPRLHLFSVLLLGPVSLFFLGEITPLYQKTLRKIVWAYVPILGVVLLSLGMDTYSRFLPWLFQLSHIAFLIPAATWMACLSYAPQKTKLTRERLRLRYAFVGGLITVGFFVTDALNFAGFPIPPLGTLARTFFLIFLFQTFIQKEMMTSEEVVAKIALFGGVALILSTIYSMLVAWVGARPDLFFFNTLIASFVIIVLFDPIRNLTSRFTRRFFLRSNAMLEDELNTLSADLMGIVEPTELSRRMALALRNCLGIRTSTLFVLERDGLSYVGVSEREGAVEELPSSSPLVEYMTLRRGRPFVVETIENDLDSFHSSQPRNFCGACLETMRALRADFIIPFVYESRVVGFSAATTDERILLSNEQLRLFIPVSRQIALLLKNAQTFTFLRDRDKLAAIGEMAAGLAHEIKNPLGAIKGAAELLKERPPHGPSEDFLGIILAETDRLSGVLSDFLDYAKPRRNNPQPACNPLRVIEHTAQMILRDTKVRVEIESEREELSLEADPEILKQVLLNLFLNAVQAMDSIDHPQLRVRIREIYPSRLWSFTDSLPIYKVWEGWERGRSAPHRPYIEIEVEDNGVGIPAEDRDRIFVPFYTTKPKGTGLGLPICQRLIEGMGGTISVKPNYPSGTIFTLHLPLRRDESGKEDALPLKSKSKELTV